jgi:5-(carboxyamino)imidazole ribonucleotide mutase
MLTKFDIPHECRVVSAHRTPIQSAEYASTALERGLEVIIAGAGGAAHLAGVVAAYTVIPVIGVPMQSAALNGLDSQLSIVQMPKGVPVATVAIGPSGAANAGLLAVAILATSRPDLRVRLKAYRQEIASSVLNASLPGSRGSEL